MALIRSHETPIDCKEVWNDLGMRQAKRFVTCSWAGNLWNLGCESDPDG